MSLENNHSVMFWMNNYASSPYIDAILTRENVTLHELMDEEDILQECKSQNKKLVEYLTRPEVLEELVTLTTKEPSAEIEERLRYKYPNLACELLTCDVPVLNEKLAGDEALLSKLYSFIDTEPPLNPLLASFFSKTIGVLVARKSDQVLEFLKSRQHCVDLLLQHLETSAIMDLVLKLVTQVEGSEMRQNILNWLNEQHLVERLVVLLSPASGVGRHSNASQLLCDMIKAGREYRITTTEPDDLNPILDRLEASETVSLLLDTILSGEKLESSIVGGIEVLLVLLGQKTNNSVNEMDNHGNGAGEDTNDSEQRIKITNATLPYLEKLHNLLIEPPFKPAVKTTVGLLELPLGNTRLHVAKLLVALLLTENSQIRETLCNLGTFQVLLDLFFKYAYNNFLHTQVEQCIALAINADVQHESDIIYDNIFLKCKIIERILSAWEENDAKQDEEKGIRQGYMGHIINIANNIVTQCEKSPLLDNFLKSHLTPECRSKWEALVTTEIADMNKIYQICLGGQQQVYMTNSEENSDDYSSYSNVAHIQHQYDNYQNQQITAEFVQRDCFYNYEKFNDGEDTLHNTVDPLNTIYFNVSEEDLDKGAEMFNKVCEQKQKAGLEDSTGIGEWGDDGDLTFQTVIDKRNWPSKQLRHNSNSFSDDDDDEPQDLHMEVDSTDPWDSVSRRCRAIVIPANNPWDVPTEENSDQTGWANFDNFESTLNIDENTGMNNKVNEVVEQDKIVVPNAVIEDNIVETTDAKAIGGGDTSKIETVEITASQLNEPILSNKVQTIDSTQPADNNANPSELIGDRTPIPVMDSKISADIPSTTTGENTSTDNVKESSETPLVNASNDTSISKDTE